MQVYWHYDILRLIYTPRLQFLRNTAVADLRALQIPGLKSPLWTYTLCLKFVNVRTNSTCRACKYRSGDQSCAVCSAFDAIQFIKHSWYTSYPLISSQLTRSAIRVVISSYRDGGWSQKRDFTLEAAAHPGNDPYECHRPCESHPW